MDSKVRKNTILGIIKYKRGKMIYTCKEAGDILGLASTSIRVYCHKYSVGYKKGRDWLLTDDDLGVIQSHMGQQGIHAYNAKRRLEKTRREGENNV